jgi:hypothetical protein
MRRLLALALALGTMAFIACAQGTSDGPSGNKPDAHIGTGTNTPDAFIGTNQPDAFVPIPDAFEPADANLPADAASGSGSGTDGAICNGDSDCDVGAGYCCFSLGGPGFCVLGTEPLPGVCLPN